MGMATALSSGLGIKLLAKRQQLLQTGDNAVLLGKRRKGNTQVIYLF